MAAPGYVQLLFPNPLNSTAIRQPKLQLVFAMKLKKVSVLSQHSLKSPNEKHVFVLKCHLQIGMPLEATPATVSAAPSVRHADNAAMLVQSAVSVCVYHAHPMYKL